MKGQISIDFLIALIVAILLIGALGLVVASIKEANEKVITQNQAKVLADDLANFISATNALSNTDFNTGIKINKLNYAGKKINPEIIIGPDTIKVKVTDINFESEKSFSAQTGTTIKTQGDFLVISHE